MDMPNRYMTFVTILIVSAVFLTLAHARPSSVLEDGWDIGSEVGNNGLEGEDYYGEDYGYPWPSTDSGATDYSDVLIQEFAEECPPLCMCSVPTVVHCSRQKVASLADGADSYDNSATRILSGQFPASVQVVHLGYNNISRLPKRLFSNMVGEHENNITKLHLQNNHISSVDPDAFAGFVRLEHLDLSENSITHLVQRCELVADGNGSTYLGSSVCFGGKTQASFIKAMPQSMRSLHLSHNDIRGIPNYSFANLRNLETLSLSWNRMTWISRKAFMGLHRLKVLQLRSNPLGPKTVAKINDVLSQFVTAVVPFEEVHSAIANDERATRSSPISDINRGQVSSVRENAMYSRGRRHRRALTNIGFRQGSRRRLRRRSNPTRYRTVQLDSLENLDIGDANLVEFPTSLPPSLLRLYLDSNFIRRISTKAIRRISRLEILHLGANRIERVQDSVFSNLNHLQLLDLSRNDLSTLTSRSFDGLDRVLSLRLNGNNRLSILPRQLFWSMPFLRLVYLQDCNLQTIPRGPWIYRIHAVWLYGNPINCNCSTVLGILSRIMHPTSHPIRVDPYRSIIWDDADVWEYQRPVKTLCAQPSHFRGYRMQDVRVHDLRCTGQDWYDAYYSRSLANMNYATREYVPAAQSEHASSKTKRQQDPNEYPDHFESESDEELWDDMDWIVELEKALPTSSSGTYPFGFFMDSKIGEDRDHNKSTSQSVTDDYDLPPSNPLEGVPDENGWPYDSEVPPLTGAGDGEEVEGVENYENLGTLNEITDPNVEDGGEDAKMVYNGGWVFALPPGAMLETSDAIDGLEIDLSPHNDTAVSAKGAQNATGQNMDEYANTDGLFSGEIPLELENGNDIDLIPQTSVERITQKQETSSNGDVYEVEINHVTTTTAVVTTEDHVTNSVENNKPQRLVNVSGIGLTPQTSIERIPQRQENRSNGDVYEIEINHVTTTTVVATEDNATKPTEKRNPQGLVGVNGLNLTPQTSIEHIPQKQENSSSSNLYEVELNHVTATAAVTTENHVTAEQSNPQGFAKFIDYDDGVVTPSLTRAENFEREVELALQGEDLQHYKTKTKDFRGWDMYRDYYADPDYSGDIGLSLGDDEEHFYDYATMADSIFELHSAGLTFEEAERTLLHSFNITLTLDDEDAGGDKEYTAPGDA